MDLLVWGYKSFILTGIPVIENETRWNLDNVLLGHSILAQILLPHQLHETYPCTVFSCFLGCTPKKKRFAWSSLNNMPPWLYSSWLSLLLPVLLICILQISPATWNCILSLVCASAALYLTFQNILGMGSRIFHFGKILSLGKKGVFFSGKHWGNDSADCFCFSQTYKAVWVISCTSPV